MAKKDKPNKWLYGWKLYVNYGSGPEYECFEYTYFGYLNNKRAYRQNCDSPHEWKQGRELNVEGITPAQIEQENARAREEYRATTAV